MSYPGYRNQRGNVQNSREFEENFQILSKDLEDLKDYNAKDLVEDAKNIAHKWQISTSQLRKIHGYIVKIWEKYRMNKVKEKLNFEEIRERLELLKPRLYYNANRIGGSKSESYKKLANILSKAIDKVKSPEGFEKFKEFYDAIIAYSKQK